MFPITPKLKSCFCKVKILFFFLFYYSIIVILFFTGFAKILNPIQLINTLKIFPFPDELILVTTTLLPIFEISLAVMLFLKIKLKLTMIFVVLLFSFFFLFSVYGFYLGLDNDCGCFGNVIQSRFGWGMILRNFILLCISLFLIFNINVLKSINKYYN